MQSLAFCSAIFNTTYPQISQKSPNSGYNDPKRMSFAAVIFLLLSSSLSTRHFLDWLTLCTNAIQQILGVMNEINHEFLKNNF